MNSTTLINDTNNNLPTAGTSEVTKSDSSPALGTSDIIAIVSLALTAVLTIIAIIIAWKQWKEPIKELFGRERRSRATDIRMRGIGRQRERSSK